MLFGLEDQNQESAPAAPEPVQHRPASQQNLSWLFALLGLLAGLGLGAVAWLVWPDTQDQITQAQVDAAIAQAIDAQETDDSHASQAFNQIAPSLIVVRAMPVESTVDGEQAGGPIIGTGVVINSQGQILTANHVIADAASIEIVFSDGTTSDAQVVTTEQTNDIAVLEATGATGTLVPAVLGNSRTMQIGDPIYAVGNPLGLTGSLSAGVVSGLNRDIPFPGDDDIVLENLIQFDAAVNQGSSGGPLLNDQGQVVGIITALADPAQSGFFVGIGFAVPIDIAAGGAANGPDQ